MQRYFLGNKSSAIGHYCAQVGTNLVFNHSFVSTDVQFGGTIKVPVYTFPTTLVNDTDVVPVDIPNWLVYMTAAEYVRNDVTRQNQYPNILAQANQLMQRMKDDNEAQVEQPYRVRVARGATW